MAAAVLDYNMFGHHHPRILALHQQPLMLSKPVLGGGPVYYHQQPEVIQLVEVSAPQPSLQHPYPSEAFSSCYSSSSDSSETDSEDDEGCTSYCSSDPEEMEESGHGYYDDTYGTRLSRVLAWRDGFAKAMGVAVSSDALSSSYSSLMKRKIDLNGVDDDALSLSQKRSRADSQVEHNQNPWPRRRLSSHSCSACDCDFATRQGLREHGRDPRREACQVAVAYDLE